MLGLFGREEEKRVIKIGDNMPKRFAKTLTRSISSLFILFILFRKIIPNYKRFISILVRSVFFLFISSALFRKIALCCIIPS